MKTGGIQLQLSTDEKSLWWDSDEHHEAEGKKEGKKGFGLLLALRWGKLYFPVPGLRWLWDKERNPWTSGKHLFVVGPFFFVFPYISIAIGKYGLYLGVKVYKLSHKDYLAWAKPEHVKEGNEALALSATIRRTRTI